MTRFYSSTGSAAGIRELVLLGCADRVVICMGFPKELRRLHSAKATAVIQLRDLLRNTQLGSSTYLTSRSWSAWSAGFYRTPSYNLRSLQFGRRSKAFDEVVPGGLSARLGISQAGPLPQWSARGLETVRAKGAPFTTRETGIGGFSDEKRFGYRSGEPVPQNRSAVSSASVTRSVS